MGVEEREITMEEALGETDQAPPKPPTEKDSGTEQPNDVLEALDLKTEPKIRHIGVEPNIFEFTQQPLGFVAKIQFFSEIGDVIDKALTGENAMTIGHLFEAPELRQDTLRAEDFRDADTFIQAIAKLVKYSPSFLLDSYCIWLAVPEVDREVVKHYMALPPQEGGLSDEEGMDIIETFIDQNWDAIDSFFREKVARVQKRIRQHTTTEESPDGSPSQLSKPSSSTPRTTRKS